jgi:L-amino acid N-acyltransferase YncA
MPEALLESLSLAKRKEEWVTRLQPSTRRNFVLEDEGIVLGWVSIGPVRDPDLNQDFGELYGIYVAPTQLRRSLGWQLYSRAEQELSNAGKSNVSLWVLERNANARRFYEKMGFNSDGATKMITLGGVDLPEIRYVKKIKMPNQSPEPALSSGTSPSGQGPRYP